MVYESSWSVQGCVFGVCEGEWGMSDKIVRIDHLEIEEMRKELRRLIALADSIHNDGEMGIEARLELVERKVNNLIDLVGSQMRDKDYSNHPAFQA